MSLSLKEYQGSYWEEGKGKSDVEGDMGRDQTMLGLTCDVNEFRHCREGIGSL